jgi:hypothetical protein|tara:strand:- start:30168 stop:30398 length:231 start_codon:yes stop_codon:yes gene_type:complete
MNNKYPKTVKQAMQMLKRENDAIKKHNEKVYKQKVKATRKFYENLEFQNAKPAGTPNKGDTKVKRMARNYNKKAKK